MKDKGMDHSDICQLEKRIDGVKRNWEKAQERAGRWGVGGGGRGCGASYGHVWFAADVARARNTVHQMTRNAKCVMQITMQAKMCWHWNKIEYRVCMEIETRSKIPPFIFRKYERFRQTRSRRA